MEETTEESTPTAADLVEAQDGPNNDEHIRLAAVMRDRDSLRSHVNRMRHNLANELAVQRELLSQDISPGLSPHAEIIKVLERIDDLEATDDV